MLLSISSDAKTSKGNKSGYLTGILYLAPFDISGYQTCPKASAGCAAACLFTAGRGVYRNVFDARVKRTKMFFEQREHFFAKLVEDIEFLARKAKREGMIPVVRLNGTSDIAWEKFPVIRDGVKYRNVMLAFPEMAFYDYTKVIGRKSALALPNYHLTFSLAEDNDKNALKAMEQGYNVAVVMNLKRSEAKPETWGGFPVIDGDVNDLRQLDPKGCIVALTAKGKARHDTTGFVRNASAGFA